MMATGATLLNRLPSLSQRSRRLAVIAAFAGYPLLQVGYSVLRATDRVSAALWAPIAIALLSATLVGSFVIYGYGRGRMGQDRGLDERQRSVADRALVVSYGVVTAFVVLALGALALWLSIDGPITLGMTELGPWLLAVGIYVPLLPFAALAWIEPDLPADDEA